MLKLMCELFLIIIFFLMSIIGFNIYLKLKYTST